MKYRKVNNGRVTIPAGLRRKHKIKPGTKIYFEETENGEIKLVPVTEELIDKNIGVLGTGGRLLRVLIESKRNL